MDENDFKRWKLGVEAVEYGIPSDGGNDMEIVRYIWAVNNRFVWMLDLRNQEVRGHWSLSLKLIIYIFFQPH